MNAEYRHLRYGLLAILITDDEFPRVVRPDAKIVVSDVTMISGTKGVDACKPMPASQ